MGLIVWMLPDLVIELVSRGLLTGGLVQAILEVIRSRYQAGVVEYSLEKLREIEDAEGRGSS